MGAHLVVELPQFFPHLLDQLRVGVEGHLAGLASRVVLLDRLPRDVPDHPRLVAAAQHVLEQVGGVVLQAVEAAEVDVRLARQNLRVPIRRGYCALKFGRWLSLLAQMLAEFRERLAPDQQICTHGQSNRHKQVQSLRSESGSTTLSLPLL